ncbi:MAG: hypothetical protein QMD22_00330 [archaeon]|nr:hypothetical protein [archaeon]
MIEKKLKGWTTPRTAPTGLFIRDYLLDHGEGYAMQIWRALKEKRGSKKVCSYSSFVANYIWILRQLGLIEKVRTEAARNRAYYDRVYYRITPGKEQSQEWNAPQKTLDPRRALGSKKYRKEKPK